jgi:hypothetical protein
MFLGRDSWKPNLLADRGAGFAAGQDVCDCFLADISDPESLWQRLNSRLPMERTAKWQVIRI